MRKIEAELRRLRRERDHYKGISLNEAGNISDKDFIFKIKRNLQNPRGEDGNFITFNIELV